MLQLLQEVRKETKLNIRLRNINHKAPQFENRTEAQGRQVMIQRKGQEEDDISCLEAAKKLMYMLEIKITKYNLNIR